MNKTAVLAALKRGESVCWRSTRWHVGYDYVNKVLYRFNVFTGEVVEFDDVSDYSLCFYPVGGVGSDD